MNELGSIRKKDSKKIKTLIDAFLTEIKKVKKLPYINPFEKIRLSIINENDELVYNSENSLQIIGYSTSDFGLLTTFGYIHPDEREKVISNYHSFDNGSSKPIIYRIFTPQGELKWIRGVAVRIIDPDTTTNIATAIFELDISTEISFYEDVIKAKEKPLFESILNLISTPFVYMRNTVIVWVNHAWERIFGYTLKEVKNQSLEIIFPEKKDFANFLLALNKEQIRDRHLYLLVKLEDKNGVKHSRTLSIITQNKDDFSEGLLIFFLDVAKLSSDLKIENEDLHFFRSIFDNYDGIIIQIAKNRIKYVNKTIERMLFYTEQEVLGHELAIFFNTKDAYKKFLGKLRTEFARNKNFNDEVVLYRKDRKPVLFTARVSPVSFDKTEDFVVALNPISALKELVNQLRFEKSELESYNDLLFHNIKNLCQDALSQLEISILQLNDKPEVAKERLEKSKEAIYQIAKITTNLENYLQIARKSNDFYEYDLYKVFAQSEEKINKEYHPRAIKIVHGLKPNKFLARGNELIYELFFNIFEKTLAYNNKPLITVEITVNDSANLDDSWEVRIKIPDPRLNKELQSFFEFEPEFDHELKGSDFTLNIITSIVNSFQGKISFEHQEDNEYGQLIISMPKQL
ncbi:MAG: PAS domain-containing protein [Candidatus Heimdallarchaeota archaeon]